MNKVLYFFILLLLVACDDSDTPTPVVSFWETPHSAFMGLTGTVSSVKEISYQPDAAPNEEEENVVEFRFDHSGRLTYYNPTGMEPDATTRWIGVAAASYHYQYDATGRMVKAVVNEVGTGVRTYTLTYGTHSCYVPLIFPVGTNSLFLVKGLIGIESSDGIRYHFEENKASYSQTSWGTVTQTVYEYEAKAVYPAREIITTTRNGELQQTKTVGYTFDVDGCLLATDASTVEAATGDVLEHTVVRYVPSKFLLVASKTIASADETFEWTYTYGRGNALVGVTGKYNGDDMGAEETCQYSTWDDQGNWTDSRQTLSSIVNWDHPDGTIGVRREITY